MMWCHERETLINRLVKLYPYSREWFESLNNAQLIAMYNRTSHKKHAAKLVDTVLPQETVRRDDPEDKGQTLVKTDGHGWEPEIN